MGLPVDMLKTAMKAACGKEGMRQHKKLCNFLSSA
jgi:hypothetical protein